MASPATSDKTESLMEPPSAPLAGFLSYLIPGLGQIYQGRITKGILFCLCVYTLFFYGMYLGSGTARVNGTTYHLSGNVYLPDTAERNNPFGLPRTAANLYNRPQFLGQFWAGIVVWPAVWQYLNYDERQEQGDPLLGHFERTPREETLNAVHTSGDKLMELGWVFTVIAGVLNIMVIYDALAGPAFQRASREPTPEAVP